MRAVFERKQIRDGSHVTIVELKTLRQTMTLIPYDDDKAKKMVSVMIEAGCVDEVEDNRF